PAGDMVAQAAHMPVHLGAMPTAIRMITALAPFRAGDVAILNDQYLGGTHPHDARLGSGTGAPRRHRRHDARLDAGRPRTVAGGRNHSAAATLDRRQAER